MAAIVWTLEAARCLEEIRDYVALDSPIAAHNVVNGIYEKIQFLRSHPRIGQRYEPVENREVRLTTYGHYRIAYSVQSESRIEIIGIFHGSMDIERYLRDK